MNLVLGRREAARRLGGAIIVDDAEPIGSSDRKAGFRTDVQGLRGIAVLLVVLYHSQLALTGGFIGVDVFFVISGFVIVRSLHTELLASGTVDLRRFYTRRVRRLMPAFAVASLVTLVGTFLVLSPVGEQQRAARTAIAASLFGANQSLYQGNNDYFGPSEESNPFLHTWSLSLEEQFYFVLPAGLLLLWRFWRRRSGERPTGAVAASIAAVAAVSLAVAVALTSSSVAFGFDFPVQLAFYAMPLRLWEFAAGVLIALAPSAMRLRSRRGSEILALGATAALLAAAVGYDEGTVFPGLTAVVPVMATAALILVTPGTAVADGILRSRPLTVIGDVSYGWYLLHWPAIVFARRLWGGDLAIVLAVIVSLVAAVAMYHTIEEPIRRNRAIAGRRVVGLAALGIALPLVAAAGVGVLAASGRTVDSPPGWGDDALPAARTDGCMIESLTASGVDWDDKACLFSPDAPGGTILLLGDSHAASLSDIVVEAASRLDHRAAVWARATCPFVGRSAPTYDACRQWQQDALALVDSLEPEVVVIANRSPAYVLPEVGTESPLGPVAGPDGSLPSDPPEALAFWEDGLGETIAGLEERGVAVVIVSTVPEYPAGSFASPTILRPEPEPPTISLTDVTTRRGAVVEIERRVADAADAVTVFDPVGALCTDGMCTPIDGERWLYSDNHHLNSYAAEIVTPSLVETLAPLLGDR